MMFHALKSGPEVRVLKRILAVSLVLAAATLTGCAPKNPAAPGGTQTNYTFHITPLAPQGVYLASCPALVVNHSTGAMSSVICSIARAGGPNALLPIDSFPEGGGHTNYYYTFAAGQVNMVWSNDAGYTPPPFDLNVAVVNP